MLGFFLILASFEFIVICWYAETQAKLQKQLKNARQDKLVMSHNIVALQRDLEFISNDHAVAEEYIELLKHSTACPGCQAQQDRTHWHEKKKPAQTGRAYYESLVNECHEIRATMASKQHTH